MKKPKKIITPDNDAMTKAASSGDMTGLIPAPAETPEEREAYNSVYAFCPDLPEKENKG